MTAIQATGPRRFHINPRITWGLMSLLVLVAIWELAVRSGLVETVFLAPPSAALAAGFELATSGDLWQHAWISLTEFFWGALAGIVVGIPVGFMMAQSRPINAALSPTVWAIYSVPRTAFVPLLLVWFGIGLTSKAAYVFLGVVFPMIANTYLGVRETDKFAIRSARSFSASRRETLQKVVLPSSIPYLVDGLRLGAGRGIVGVIIAELYVSEAGIGNIIRLAGLGFQTAELLFLVIMVAAFGIVVSQALIWFERRFASWRRAGTAAE